jgi:hypothetical protein
MNKLLGDNLGAFYARESQSAAGLAILPLFRRAEAEHHYISLRKAFSLDAILITEISEGGSVPNLKVANRGTEPVLILDGEELKGAKQNRVLNVSVLIPPQSELVIPVSCTEAGRWGYNDPVFRESGNVMSPSIKMQKMRSVSENMASSGSRHSNQSQVWNEIDEIQDRHNVHSRTSAMEDVYVRHEQDLERIREAFPRLEGQCGIYAEIGGRFAGIDLVSRDDVWKDLHDKILRSYALDVLGRNLKEAGIAADSLEKLIARLLEGKVSSYKGVGLGDDLRIQTEGLTGSALVWEKAIVNLAVYPFAEARERENFRSSRRFRM